ncbi:nitroreductase family protein [Pseudonocardia sp. GCM10023141]|uniref:nitroreductase family protein n=1 Tax=Pseudonocardia sp. GCM10023141 TaxID=3252653 RepID=UPI00361710E4
MLVGRRRNRDAGVVPDCSPEGSPATRHRLPRRRTPTPDPRPIAGGHTQTRDAIRARRNVRSYGAEPLPDDALTRILDAGRRAPSAGNRQHRDFVLVTDRQQLTELSTVWVGPATSPVPPPRSRSWSRHLRTCGTA